MMPDRDKVIKELEHCSCIIDEYDVCEGCPYKDADVNADVNADVDTNAGCHIVLMKDAMELLKEQEPVKPIRLENWWKCPSCSGNIVANMKYCPRCGRAVKWNG